MNWKTKILIITSVLASLGAAYYFNKKLIHRLIAGKFDTRIVSVNNELKIGTHPWPGYEFAFLARNLGHYKNKNIRLIENLSASQTIGQLQLGEIQAGALTLDEVLLAVERGVKLYIVMIISSSKGADGIVAGPELKSMQALIGKTVGVDNSVLGGYVLKRALEKSNLKIDQINILPMEVIDHAEAFESKKVSAVVTYEPTLSRLLKRGGNLVFDSTEIPNEIIDVLVIRQDALEENATRMTDFLYGWFNALGYFVKFPELADQILAKHMQIPQNEVRSIYDRLEVPGLYENLKYFEGEPPPLQLIVENIYLHMREGNLIKREINTNELIVPDNLNFLKALGRKY